MLRPIQLCLLVSVNSSVAYGEITSVEGFMKACEYGLTSGTNDVALGLACLTGVTLVSQMAEFNCRTSRTLGKLPDAKGLAATFDNVTPEVLAQTFMNWARLNPKMWDYPAAVGVSISFSEAYPCADN